MGGLLYRIFDTAIVLICLPAYALFYPISKIYEYFEKRKPISLGLEVVHWPMSDVREDLKVVDLSRLKDGLVGVCKRRYNVMRRKVIPPYEEQVSYITVADFWMPHPL